MTPSLSQALEWASWVPCIHHKIKPEPADCLNCLIDLFASAVSSQEKEIADLKQRIEGCQKQYDLDQEQIFKFRSERDRALERIRDMRFSLKQLLTNSSVDKHQQLIIEAALKEQK